MRFLINPPMKSVKRASGKAVSTAAWRKSGFRRNPRKPTARQLAARKKFAAMARARAKAARGTRRARITSETPTMAHRKRKAAHRRKTTRRARSRSRSRRTLLLSNPRKRTHKRRRRATARRRGFRRNPPMGRGLLGTAKTLGIGLGAALAGVAVGNFLSVNITPKIFPVSPTDTPTTAAAKNLAVSGALAIGVAHFGKKLGLPEGVAALIAIGILIVPARNMIYTMAPAGTPFTFLGGGTMRLPTFPGPRSTMGAYAPGNYQGRGAIGMGAYPRRAATPLGAYPSRVQAYPTSSMQPG
ncbi:MAG TPA: hypothetical protein VH374_26270 [Polyangia bacterium]|jgi:hypothetical protein|nr:hypothetical protein [Polyangia bacterium]